MRWQSLALSSTVMGQSPRPATCRPPDAPEASRELAPVVRRKASADDDALARSHPAVWTFDTAASPPSLAVRETSRRGFVALRSDAVARMGRMVEVRTAHTADLDIATLEAVRSLLDAVFEGDMSDHDWEHSLGGVHALAWEGGEVVGHASVVQRRLLHRGRALRTGYVEGVGVRADCRRRGHGGAMMHALGQVVRGAYELGALGATDAAAGFYAAHGWHLWQGPTSALTPTGIRRTEGEDGSIYVLPVATPLDVFGELTCDWRDGDLW
jgi:aminoglycoside 2'-N-acetyltransferase I